MAPPPHPKKVEFQIFWGRQTGALRLAGGKLLRERLEDAHQQAADWMNQHPTYEVITISNGSSENSGASSLYVTVWYRPG